MERRNLLVLLGGVVCQNMLLGTARPALAQGTWPTEPVRLVVPFAPGGATDIAARLFADELSKILPQRVVIENRSGAGVSVGSEAVAKAPKDGYTLLYNTMAHSVMKAMLPRLAFDPVADFAPVALIGSIPMVLLANKDLPARTLPDLVKLLRHNPGRYDYGSGGVGSATHLVTELFLKRAGGLHANHIPYRGAVPAMLDLVAGRIALFLDVANTGVGYHQRSEARGIAVSSEHRIREAPDIPTFAEGGVSNAEASTWHMVLAPAGTPAPAVRAANAAFKRVLASPQVQERLAQFSIEVNAGSTPESTAQWLRQEVARWDGLIREAGIKPE